MAGDTASSATITEGHLCISTSGRAQSIRVCAAIGTGRATTAHAVFNVFEDGLDGNAGQHCRTLPRYAMPLLAESTRKCIEVCIEAFPDTNSVRGEYSHWACGRVATTRISDYQRHRSRERVPSLARLGCKLRLQMAVLSDDTKTRTSCPLRSIALPALLCGLCSDLYMACCRG
jgi:hypothetical protein